MKTQRLRIIIPLVLLAVAGIGFVLHTGTGTLSALGWQSVSVLCPLGALGTLIASKTFVPHVLVSLVIAVIGIVLLGRAFCAWACPVPLIGKLRTVFSRQQSPSTSTKSDVATPLSAEEKKALKTACGAHRHAAPADSRHIILGGALLSAAIFGFPVFCLICPIGLSFALVFVLIMLFGTGDVTWSVVVIPALLLVEVVFFRKWCSHICPLSSLMSLIGRANRTFRPTIDDSACLETSQGAHCGKCAEVCEAGINPRHPQQGTSWQECTKCRACVESCPGGAITMPFLPKASGTKPDAAGTDCRKTDAPAAASSTSAASPPDSKG